METHELTSAMAATKPKRTGFAPKLKHVRRDLRRKQWQPRPNARWSPEDGQHRATVNRNLLANDECCADARPAAGCAFTAVRPNV